MPKLKNTIKVIGLLTILGAAAAKMAPLLKSADPKLRKKFENILSLLIEIKEDIMDIGEIAKKEIKKAKKK